MIDTASKTPATPGQLFEIGNAIGGAVGKLLAEEGLSFSQAKELIEIVGKKAIMETAGVTVENLISLLSSDPIMQYKKDLQEFFSKMYGLQLNLSKVPFPSRDGFSHYMVCPPGLSITHVYTRFPKLDSITHRRNPIADLTKLRDFSKRPEDLYAFSYRPGIRPDTEHANKCHKVFMKEPRTYMTAVEYVLCWQFMWWKHKIKLDRETMTLTTTISAVHEEGCCVTGFIRGAHFNLGKAHCSKAVSNDGPREICLA
ncbi:MAG: hypothetical protein V4478_02430 [Patescibacteria group bacterium]